MATATTETPSFPMPFDDDSVIEQTQYERIDQINGTLVATSNATYTNPRFPDVRFNAEIVRVEGGEPEVRSVQAARIAPYEGAMESWNANYAPPPFAAWNALRRRLAETQRDQNAANAADEFQRMMNASARAGERAAASLQDVARNAERIAESFAGQRASFSFAGVEVSESSITRVPSTEMRSPTFEYRPPTFELSNVPDPSEPAWNGFINGTIVAFRAEPVPTVTMRIAGAEFDFPTEPASMTRYNPGDSFAIPVQTDSSNPGEYTFTFDQSQWLSIDTTGNSGTARSSASWTVPAMTYGDTLVFTPPGLPINRDACINIVEDVLRKYNGDFCAHALLDMIAAFNTHHATGKKIKHWRSRTYGAKSKNRLFRSIDFAWEDDVEFNYRRDDEVVLMTASLFNPVSLDDVIEHVKQFAQGLNVELTDAAHARLITDVERNYDETVTTNRALVWRLGTDGKPAIVRARVNKRAQIVSPGKWEPVAKIPDVVLDFVRLWIDNMPRPLAPVDRAVLKRRREIGA